MLKPVIEGFKSGADLSALQYCLLKFGADSTHLVKAAAAEKCMGVLMNVPQNSAEKDIEVAVDGGAKVIAGDVVTLGASVTSDANGKLVVATTGQWAIGVAMDSGVLGDVVPIIINRHTAP